MKRTLVTILSPCYNVEKFLPKCLDSIINQTYSNLQIVMIDDGSKDNTWGILQEYAAKYPQTLQTSQTGQTTWIEVYHQENQGVAYTRNQLLDKIKGDYFLFVDSDDWIEPEMVDVLVTYAKCECADMVTCEMVVNDTEVKYDLKKLIYNRREVTERFLYHLEFRGSLCNKLCKRSLLEHAPSFHSNISYGEDALFCWELLKGCNKVVVSSRQFYHYRMNSESICHGKFGSKKLSGHGVWNKLCEETEKLYPEFLVIARARFCIETTLLLRDAAHCGYREMGNVKMLQRTIKQYWYCLNKVNITSLKMKIYAFLACRSYWLASKI